MDLEALTRESARALPTVAAPAAGAGLLRMDANTNLLGPNPVIRRVLERDAGGDFAHYPSPAHSELRSVLAARHGLRPEEILIGAGADELIDVVVRAFVNPGDAVAVAVPTFELYAFCARVEGARVLEAPLGPGFELDAEALGRAPAKVTFIATPNNPTGNAHPMEALERVLKASLGIVVLDEAYVEFGGRSFLPRIREFPNLVVLRTFSKAYGLAGLRVGWAAARSEIIERLTRVKIPFTVGSLSERIAAEAVRDESFVRHSCEAVAAERPRLAGQLASLGLMAHPSDANFLLVRVGPKLNDLVRRLLDRGIAVRALRPGTPVDGCFRVTVGRAVHTDALISAIRESLMTTGDPLTSK